MYFKHPGSYLDALTTEPSPKTTSYSSTHSWYKPTCTKGKCDSKTIWWSGNSKLHTYKILRQLQLGFGHLVTVGGHTHTKSKSPQSRVCQRKIICLEILLLHLPHKIVVVGACEHCKHDRLYDYMMIIWLNKSVTCNFKGDGKSVPPRNQVTGYFPNLILFLSDPSPIIVYPCH